MGYWMRELNEFFYLNEEVHILAWAKILIKIL